MKTNGVTWKAYINSWPKDQWFDDSDELINGEPGDNVVGEIPDDAVVEFTCGVVYANANDHEGKSLTAHFRSWLRGQSHTNLVVCIPKDKQPELTAFLKTIQGKILGN